MVRNNCEISIEIDGDRDVYYPGDTVTGTVVVTVDEECWCDGLDVALEWYTHGEATTGSEVVERERIYVGEWTEDRVHERRFEVEMPPGPYTYEGKSVNVDWRLKVQADIPWAFDPEVGRELVLKHDGETSEYRPGSREYSEVPAQQSAEDRTAPGKQLALAGVIFALGAGGCVYTWVHNLRSWVGEAGFFAVISAVVLYTTLQEYLAESRLGGVDVTFGDLEVQAGEAIRCRIELDPDGPVELNHIALEVCGYEEAVSGRGSEQNSDIETVFEERVSLTGDEGETVEGGEVEYSTELAVPEDAPCSLYSETNNIRWEAEIDVDIPNWPDWTDQRELIVKPSVQPGSGIGS